LYVSIGKSTGQNQSHITTSTVANDGYGLCLSRSRERVDSPINHPLEDGPEEFGDGTATHSLLECSAQAAQLHTQQSAQPHTISSNAPSEPPLRIQSDTVHTNVDAQQPTGIPHMPEQIGPQTRNYQKKGKKKKNTRASLKIASLNMRGRGPVGDNKWTHINQIMKEQRLGILAVQEAHLTQEHVDNLHTHFGKRLQIHFSQGPNANAQGVAIVLNKELTNIKGVQQQTCGSGPLLCMAGYSTLWVGYKLF
jgi:hypothetical protein